MSAVRSIRINEDLQNRVESFAHRRQRTVNFIIKEALQSYLETKEREEEVVQAAKEAWAEFQSTGQGAEWADVRQWIASWGGPEELPAPKCREL